MSTILTFSEGLSETVDRTSRHVATTPIFSSWNLSTPAVASADSTMKHEFAISFCKLDNTILLHPLIKPIAKFAMRIQYNWKINNFASRHISGFTFEISSIINHNSVLSLYYFLEQRERHKHIINFTKMSMIYSKLFL